MPAAYNSIEERMDRQVMTEPMSGCWIWIGARNRAGYGHLGDHGRDYLAHRFFYEKLRAPIPAGLGLDHLCRLPACVNPDHVEPVRQLINVHRGDAINNGRLQRARTHCPKDHPYDEENTNWTYRHGYWKRDCRECRRRRDRERLRLKRAIA